MNNKYYGTLLCILVFSFLTANISAFDIKKFSDPEKYGWENFESRKNYRDDLLERQELLQIYEMKKKSLTVNMLKSTLLPGWGHMAAQHVSRGQIILGLEIITLSTSFYFYDQAMEYYDKYKKATQIDEIEQNYNDAVRPYRFSQAFFGLSVAIWAYNILDTYYVTQDYNNEKWNNIYKKYRKKRIIISPTGITLRF